MNIASLRLHNQRLVGAPLERAADVVRWLGAVQAQDYHGAKWALGQRTRDATDAAVERAFDEGSILRTHVMRPTWHFVAPEDIRWLLALTGPRVHAVNAHYDRKLELDAATIRRGYDLLVGALQGGHALTRQQLAAALERGGIAASGQRLAYLVMSAELDALICSGPIRGKQFTYALLDERVAPAPAIPREEALAELSRRYVTSHGPATAHDFAWWSGLTVADARVGLGLLGRDVERVSMGGKTYWTPASAAPVEADGPRVHLLPNYDEHVVAYKDHGPTLDPGAIEVLRLGNDGALDAHLIAVNGLVVGGWRRAVGKTRIEVKTRLLVPLRKEERKSLQGALEDYGRFMGRSVALAGD